MADQTTKPFGSEGPLAKYLPADPHVWPFVPSGYETDSARVNRELVAANRLMQAQAVALVRTQPAIDVRQHGNEWIVVQRMFYNLFAVLVVLDTTNAYQIAGPFKTRREAVEAARAALAKVAP